MAAPSVFAIGTAATATTADSLSIPVPAGVLTGKVLFAFISCDGGVTVDSEQGWTAILNVDGKSVDHLALLYKRWDGSEATPVVFQTPGNVTGMFGLIVAFSDVKTSGSPLGATFALNPTSTLSTATLDGPTITTDVDDNLIIFVGHELDPESLQGCSGYSGTNPTFTEQYDSGYFFSNFQGLQIATGSQTPAASTGARTATYAAAVDACIGVMFALRPIDLTPSNHAMLLRGT